MKTSGFVFKVELRGLLKLSLPIIFTQFIQVSNTTVAILMMGRVGSVELAALGLGGSFDVVDFGETEAAPGHLGRVEVYPGVVVSNSFSVVRLSGMTS